MHKGFWPHAASLEDCRQWEFLSLEEILITLDRDGVRPSADDFISILQKCKCSKSLHDAKRVQDHVRRFGLDAHSAIGNHMVPTLVDCGGIAEAQEVFSRLAYKSVHSWTSLMLGYIECKRSQDALELYQKMQEERVEPSSYTLVAALKACTELDDVHTGRIIHGDVTLLGFEGDVFVGSSIVSMYANCGLLEEAQEACDKLEVRNVVTWNALIAGYCTFGLNKEALICFDRMQREGVLPSTVTYTCILKACGSIPVQDQGGEVHSEAVQKGVESDIFIGSSLVDMYAKFGNLLEATEIFYKLPARNVVSWNALITGYGEHGPCEEALRCFEQMEYEVSPNASTYACALKACASIQAIRKGREIHLKVVQNGLTRDIMVGTGLVDMYAKSGLLREAQDAFDELDTRSIATWNALITGYAEHGPGEKALSCFERLQGEKVYPNAITYVCMLKACGNVGAIDLGQDLHLHVSLYGLDTNIFVSSSLVGMYLKCGSLSEACKVFESMPFHNVVSWNSMIKGFGVNEDGEIAMKLFKDMQERGVKPDARTFVCLLLACSRTKMFAQGQEFLQAMRDKYDIMPSSEHLTCMVDLFARLGFLREAQRFMESLPGSPSEDMLRALLSSCGTFEEGELGFKCFEQLAASI